MDNITLLAQTFDEKQKALMLPQTVWVTAKEIDWSKKTMTATGIVDGLDIFDVLLGIGNDYRKPKKGSKCLLSMIEGFASAFCLIHAEEIEESITTVGNAVFTMKPAGFVIEVGGVSLGPVMSDFLKAMQALTVGTGTGPSTTPINIADFAKVESDLNKILI